jgi:hypothetical protein
VLWRGLGPRADLPGLCGRAARSGPKQPSRSDVAAHVTAPRSRLPRVASRLPPAVHTTIATSARALICDGVDCWGIRCDGCLAQCDMRSPNIGTSQLPLAGAILCCTSIAPEQRVRDHTYDCISNLTSSSRHLQALARNWARLSSSTSPQT